LEVAATSAALVELDFVFCVADPAAADVGDGEAAAESGVALCSCAAAMARVLACALVIRFQSY